MALTVQTFPFKRNFERLGPDVIAQAIADMSIQFSGTQELWSKMEQVLAQAKRDLVMALIVAWHLADLYPEDTEGVMNNAGMPLSSKEDGGVVLKFLPLKVQDAMYPFLTNTFGIRALSMIMSAPERYRVQGDRGTYNLSTQQSYDGSLV